MDKNKYLQTYKDGISIFVEKYQQEKVLELDEKITKLMKEGKSEEEAILSLGDVNDLIKKVYKENHVDYERKAKGKLILKFEQFIELIHHVIDVMSKNTSKANRKIIFDLLLLILFVCILKIPFIVVRDFGNSLLDFIPIPLVLDLWHLLMEFIYIVVAIIVFLYIFKKWFQNLNDSKK